MKRIIVILIFLFTVLYVYADDICDLNMREAKALFEKGLYPSAKEKFYKIKDICEGYNLICDEYIRRCEDSISAKEQHRRMLEVRERKERGEKEYKERIERRNRNRYVYLSVNNDVPGRFSKTEDNLKSDLLKKGIHFTNDSIQAYFYVRVAVSIFDESSHGESRYRVYASVEVENATESDYETKSYFTQGEGCCNTEMIVADEIYDNGKNSHLFRDIENNIIRLLGVNNIHDGKDVGNSSLNNPINVAVKVTSDQNCSVTAMLKSRLENNFDHTGGCYIVLSMDDSLKRELDEWIDAYENRYVPSNKRVLKGDQMGVDKVCKVEISEANDGLRFFCDFIDRATGAKEPVSYSTSDNYPKVCCSSSIDRVYIVADELTRQLGIPSSNLKDLDKRIDDIKQKEEHELNRTQDSLERALRANIARSFVPCFYQWYNDKPGGWVIFAGELLSIGSGLVFEGLRYQNTVMANKTTGDIHNAYAAKANRDFYVRNISFGAAALVYLYNIYNAHTSIRKDKNSPIKRTVCLNPTITDQSVALSLSINF